MKDRALGKPTLITTNDALENLVSNLLSHTVIAVDTESNSLFAYQEQVCLVQFSTRQADFLVDPLAIGDLSPLDALFKGSRVEKVFHAAEYDLICLKRDFGFEFNSLFDSMVAAGILGYHSLGLGSILEDKFGVRMNKRYQRANWGERPLPSFLKKYAQQDTHYLIPLRDQLRDELHQRGLWSLASEDFKRLCKVKKFKKGSLNHSDVEKAVWRINGVYDLDPQKAAVLVELCRYRDEIARKQDKPLFKVINDQTLLSIAQQIPLDVNTLSEVPGMSKHQVRRHGSHLIGAVRKGLQSTPVFPPNRRKPNGQFLNRIDTLKRWRKDYAGKMGVNPDVVLPRDLLVSVAKRNPSCIDELDEVMHSVPWRMEHFGDQIIAVLKD